MHFNLLMFFFSAILIASIGIAPAFGQTDILMSVETDKSFYLDGDVIVITGEVEKHYLDTPVTVIVKSPNGNIVEVDQLTVNADKKYSTEIKSGGLLMTNSGIYTILVYYGPIEQSVTFELITSELLTGEIISGTLLVDDSSKSIGYEITGGDILGITPDVDSHSLIVDIDAVEYGSVTLVIPRTIFDSVENGEDSKIFVLVDNNETTFGELRTSTDRTITISFPAGAKTIEIVGTFVVPEFGTIAAMILAVAIISIIAISAKSRLSIMPRY